MKDRFELFIFDWDGTLFDSVSWIVECVQQAALECDLPVPSEAVAKSVIGLGLREAMDTLCPDAPSELVLRLADRYRHHYSTKPTSAADIFEGVPDMLAELRGRGYRLAVATGKTRAGLDHALAATGLGGWFHATRCADETASKPDPAMLAEILAELSTVPGRAVMVGDSLHDLRMAHNAGMPAIAVGHGANTLDELAALNPLACLATTRELLDLLA